MNLHSHKYLEKKVGYKTPAQLEVTQAAVLTTTEFSPVASNGVLNYHDTTLRTWMGVTRVYRRKHNTNIMWPSPPEVQLNCTRETEPFMSIRAVLSEFMVVFHFMFRSSRLTHVAMIQDPQHHTLTPAIVRGSTTMSPKHTQDKRTFPEKNASATTPETRNNLGGDARAGLSST